MRTSQKERDEFIAILTKELPDLQPFFVADLARKFMRAAHTLHRLAEASCNGDWPADNGQRKVDECQACEGLWAPSVIKTAKMIDKVTGEVRTVKACPDCRTEARVKALAAEYGLQAITQGDPRGAVLKIAVPSGRTNDVGREGICVP